MQQTKPQKPFLKNTPICKQLMYPDFATAHIYRITDDRKRLLSFLIHS